MELTFGLNLTGPNMSLRYEVLDNNEVNERNLCDWGKLRDNGSSFFRVENGVYTYLGSDNGEPEDKNFLRDFSWFLEELNYAKDFHKKAMLQLFQMNLEFKSVKTMVFIN